MTVRSRRLFGPVTLPVPATLIYTVPAGRTARLLQLVVAGALPPGVTVTFYVNGTTAANAIATVTRADNPDGQLHGVWVLHPADQLFCGGGAVGLVAGVSGHGALLLGAPG